MGHSYFGSAEHRKLVAKQERDEKARVADARHKLAAKIVMAIVDRVVLDIVRPGPLPEERECYEMAGELRAIVPDLEALAKQIIDVEGGVE